jgi:hypothetical protein
MAIQQDWDGSMLGSYLLRDYWSLDGGLCILSGFDYSASIESAPYQHQWMHTLDPGTLQGHRGKDADKAEDLLNRMNDRLNQLRIIWDGCKRDIEAEDYPPAFFIEWALSKNFRPDWLDWAIERKLYIPSKPTIEATPKTLRPDIPTFDSAANIYPPELDIANKAWLAVSSVEGKGKPKARIRAWLDQHYADAELSKEAKERISIVTNWNKTGGATKIN